jgi:hypothetical protein
MTTYQTRVLAAFLRVEDYFRQAGEDFFASPRNRELIPELSQIIRQLQELSPRQAKKTKQIPAANDAAVMALARELRDELLRVTRSCRALTDIAPELRAQFRMPRSPGLSALMKTARDFIRRTTPEVKALFLDTELPPDYLEIVSAKLKAIEEVMSQRSSVRKSRSSATSEVAAIFARGMTIMRKLDVAVRNKLTDPEALEIWRTARNVELLHRPPFKRRLNLPKEPNTALPVEEALEPQEESSAASEDQDLVIEPEFEDSEELAHSDSEELEPEPSEKPMEEPMEVRPEEPVKEPLEAELAPAETPVSSAEPTGASDLAEEQPAPKQGRKRQKPAPIDMQGDLFGGLNS